MDEYAFAIGKHRRFTANKISLLLSLLIYDMIKTALKDMGFVLNLCNTNAKPAIKQNDKPVTVCQELFEKIQIKKGVTTKPKSSNNFEC